MDIFVSEFAFLVHYEKTTLADPVIGTIRTVLFGYFSLGVKIAQEIV